MPKLTKDTAAYIGLISLTLMFTLPFMVSYHHWPELHYYPQALAFALGLGGLFIFMRSTEQTIRLPYIAVVPSLLAALLLVQWVLGLSVYWQETALGFLYLLWSVLLMLITAQLKQQFGLVKIVTFLSKALVIGAAFNSVVVLMQLFGADNYFWTFPTVVKNYTGNFAQRNLLVDYISLAIASLLYLYIKGNIQRNSMLALLGFFIIVLSLTGARMAWLYLLMVTIILTVYGLRSQDGAWRNSLKIVIALPVIFGVIQWLLPHVTVLFAQYAQAIPPTPAERLLANIGQHSIRLEYIRDGLSVALAHPWLGVGWGQYTWYDLLSSSQSSTHNGFSNHTHNLYLQLLVELGVFAFVTLLIGSVWWFVNMIKRAISLEYCWVLLLAAIIFSHSMLEYPLWHAQFLGVFCVVVALGSPVYNWQPRLNVLPKLSAITVLLAGVALVSVTTIQYRQIETWMSGYKKASMQQQYGMLSEMTALLPKTLMAVHLHMMLTRAYSLLPSEKAPIKGKIIRYEAMLHHVQAGQDIYRYVLLLAEDGQTEKAVTFLHRAYNRRPGYADKFAKQVARRITLGESFVVLQTTLRQLQSQSFGKISHINTGNS